MGNRKVLTVFYSHSGNTRACADQIHNVVGGDMEETFRQRPFLHRYGVAQIRLIDQ